MATEERVLCFERKLLEELGVFQGLSLEVDKYLPVVTSPSRTLYRNRSEAEQDKRYKQLIPYVLILCQDRILRYRRGKGGQETRLHGLYSVGIGGHISEEDHGLFSNRLGYHEGMRRELMEEVAIDQVNEAAVALINDDSTEVGFVHFGVVHVMHVTSEEIVGRRSGIVAPEFVPLAEAMKDPASYESWSRFCLENLQALLAKAAAAGVHVPLGIRSILVPTDFSPPSEEAIGFAAQFASDVRAKITLLHVIEPLPTPDIAYHPLVLADDVVIANTERELKQLPTQKEMDPALFEPPIVRTGVPFHEITTAAKTRQDDLIMIPTHGFTGVKRVLFGSTAERVVRHASCPVWVIRPAEKRTDATLPGAPASRAVETRTSFRRILVPVDFSDASKAALRYATRFAERFGSVLHLVYVVDTQKHLRLAEPVTESPDVARETTALREKLAAFAKAEIQQLVPTFAHVEMGRPAEQIVAVAHSHAADLIVISTHGRTGLKHVLLGSVAEHVVRQAPCSVLVLPQMREAAPATRTSAAQ